MFEPINEGSCGRGARVCLWFVGREEGVDSGEVDVVCRRIGLIRYGMALVWMKEEFRERGVAVDNIEKKKKPKIIRRDVALI